MRVGDRVELVEDKGAYFKKGEKGKITGIGPLPWLGCRSYKVEFNNGRRMWVREDSMRRISVLEEKMGRALR